MVDGARFADDVSVDKGCGSSGHGGRRGGGGLFDSDVEDLEEGGGRQGGGGGGGSEEFLDDLTPAGSDQNGGDYGRVLAVSKQGPRFSEKLIEEYQAPWQPSATPSHLQHRFMVSSRLQKTCTGCKYTL